MSGEGMVDDRVAEGQSIVKNEPPEPPILYEGDCRSCSGRGTDYNRLCDKCDGTGKNMTSAGRQVMGLVWGYMNSKRELDERL